MNRQIPDYGFSGKVLNGSGVEEGKLDRGPSHTKCEEQEQASEGDGDDPMNIDDSSITICFRQEYCHDYQDKQTKHGAPCCELDEKFERRFADHASDPRTEMVHLSYATIDLPAVVSTIWFPVLAG